MCRNHSKRSANTDKIFKRGTCMYICIVCSCMYCVHNAYYSTCGKYCVVLLLSACEEAMELYMEQMKLQAERKPLPKQESRAYTKIKVNYTVLYYHVLHISCILYMYIHVHVHSCMYVHAGHSM